MGSHQQPDPAATQAPPPLFGGFVTGHGTSVGVSQQALDFARQLLAVEEVSTAAEDLPIGTTWPLLNVVTAEGLVPHRVQPDIIDQVDHRDPASLAGRKRRIGEE